MGEVGAFEKKGKGNNCQGCSWDGSKKKVNMASTTI